MCAVYLIRAGATGPVKIGKADDPQRRLYELQTAHWDELCLLRAWVGGEPEEAALHVRFAELHIRGDWFSFSRAMLGDIGLPEIPVAPHPTHEPEAEFYGRLQAITNTGERLRCWRDRRNMTQRELASAVGMSPAGVAHWELGNNHPSLDRLRRAAAVLNVTLDELLAPAPTASPDQHSVEVAA
jgi:DNA-binding XRE family transcriptional regulator